MARFTSILLVLFHTITIALASTNYPRASIQASSPFDHTWIEKWAAIGDSYASGIGAGHYIKATDNVQLNPGGFFKGYCYQYSYGYANLLNSNGNLGIQPNRVFQYLACSGALAAQILSDQVPLLNSPQLVTISAGGNDANLAELLNWCVYQWFTPSWGVGCDQRLSNARDKVDSPEYVQGLTDLINAVISKMDDPSNRIYWVGYNKFFDTTTLDCDTVTWAIPRLSSYQYLTIERRQSMDSLVDLVNEKIKGVVQAAGSQVVFVDWQGDTDLLGGRYCEPGVDEHWIYSKGMGVSQDREETVFYEWGTTKDNDTPDESSHDELKKRQDITAPLNTDAANATFEGAIANYIQQGILQDPDSYEALPDDGTYNVTGSFLPAKYGRVFHPTKYGHSIIAKNIINAITEEQAKLMNQPAVTTTYGCSVAAATTTTGAPTPTVSPGNNCNGAKGNASSQFDSQMLRILPLGGSITWGQQSPSGNGYRKYLRDLLIYNGANVNMVGTIKHGTMDDNENEGWPGFRVDQISDRSNNDLTMLPNLVLINAGTNDVAQNYNIDSIEQTMEDLVNKLLDNIPGTVVIVSTLLVNRNATKQALTEQVNPKYIDLVEKLAGQGKLVYLADMSLITTDMINARDGTHPTDYGYEVMANLWYIAIQEVMANCWLTPPVAVSGMNDSDIQRVDTTCDPDPTNFPAPIQIQKGSGYNDSNYHHVGHPYGEIILQVNDTAHKEPHTRAYWADINGDGIDDFIYNYDSGNFAIALNDGTGKLGTWTLNQYSSETSMGLCPDMRFGDINGDGLADLFCVDTDGSISAYLNGGAGDFPAEPLWISVGVIMPAQGYSNDMVRLADIDGDGRVDYLGIDSGGAVRGWRNVGTENNVPDWIDMGNINFGGTMGDVNGIRFVDINGDGRADWAWVSNSGQIYTSINQRGSDLSYEPVWLPTLLTHEGTGQGGPNVTDRSHVLLGNVISKNFTADTDFPKYDAQGVDYTTVFENTETHSLHAHVLGNAGFGGARTKGDGVQYCDMRGSGTDDFVWIGKTGNLTLHSNNHMLPSWGQYQHILIGTESLMSGHVRKDIHLADLDGDGKCDFLLVDEESNSIHMLRNDYSRETDTFEFTDVGIVSGGISCSEHYGSGLFDLAVRFADIDGDGKADVLCISQDGTVNGWLNKGLNNFQSAGVIKSSEERERANLRFADVNGDGRADFIALDPISGTADAWTNGGSSGGGGETFSWSFQGSIFHGGYLRGECVYFANINGYGRADYVFIEPNLARGDVIYNTCS